MSSDSDDDLRAELARLDPVPPTTPVDPASGPRAHELMERAMTDLDDRPATPRPTRSRALLAGAAAAAVLVAGGGTYAALSGGEGTPTPLAKPTAVTFTLPADDGLASGSCLRLDAAGLAVFPVAFAGTVTAVDGGTGGTVTVDVTRWYRGGSAEQVTMQGTGGSPALTGTEFTAGEQVLVTASDGQVTGCGYSGVASAELTALYDEAFGG